MLRIGIGPGKIEHELTARVRFSVQGQGAHGSAVGIVDDEVPGGPAGARHGAAGFFERQEKFVAQERLSAAGQGIPARRIDLSNAVEKPRFGSNHA